ncbi:MAG: GGDEF domain-containing protein, partial [Candidatus Eremiobacteraeota bacterium]|nr:GGDEF domain-containing protein [Candidatus Eremiobacteraeota bacterium]
LWEILADVGISIQTICISGLSYFLLVGSAGPLSVRGLLALLAVLVIYGIADHLIAATALGMLSKNVQKTWTSMKEKTRILNIGFAPIAIFILPIGKINPWYLVFLLIPLFVFRLSMYYAIQQRKLVEQEEMDRLLSLAEREAERLKKENVALGKDLQRKLDELSIFSEVGQALGASVGLDETMEVILSMFRRLIVFQSCVIFLLDGDNLVPARSMTPHQEKLEMASILDLEESIITLAINKRYPVLVSDMLEESTARRIFEDERSVMCVPLMVQNEPLGVIYVGAPRPGYFEQEHLYILSMIANAGAIAIRSSQLYDAQVKALKQQQKMNLELDFRVRQLEGLMELGQELATSLSLEETLNAIMDRTLAMVPAQSAALFYYTYESPNMEPWKVRGPYSEILGNLTPSTDKNMILGWAAEEKRALLLEDTGKSRLTGILNYERSVMVAPLMVENEVFAVLYVGAAQPNTFEIQHFDLFRTIVYQAALAIRNADLFERVSAMATTDGLTGLYTHRHFHDTIADEIDLAKKSGRAISLLMIDTDHFKEYNDTLGHPRGDIALKEIAKILRLFEREDDLACRYGGDEFVLLLNGVGKRNSRNIAESIREKVEARFAGHKVKITVSIGSATFPDDATDKNQLINAADEALYRAKKRGRNIVCMA